MDHRREDREREAIRVVTEALADPRLASGNHSDEEWSTSRERVQATRDRVLADPRAAELEDRKHAEITRRVRALQSIRGARGSTGKQLSAQVDIG